MDCSNHHLLHLLNQQVRILNKQINDKLKDFGLYTSQWSVLYCLYKNGPMTQTAIWQYLNVEAPTVTRTLTRLEEKGWITRKPGVDRRARIIQINESSFDQVADLADIIRTYEDEELLGLTKEEEHQLRSLLNRLGTKE
ncbi:MarR family winged helix-turn-helix transcriptional regulator [Halobacillus naozhouensis]|uniref:MarR family transcriptional regulator n=1 Tax=Halobacillus naozhouensis TaxID=554880 RepID=A0ABY8IWX7_9BACI|nr:MarR family transcriptional regulator [Halobacillus naozhouensis]WFT74715.1 MarR family transcriptional regulator [Halobacillus naozhouensis]